MLLPEPCVCHTTPPFWLPPGRDAPGLECVGNVLDENQAQHDVLVFGGVHVGAQLVGRGPECFFDVFDHEVVVESGIGGWTCMVAHLLVLPMWKVASLMSWWRGRTRSKGFK